MASWRAVVFTMIVLAIAVLTGLLPFYQASRAKPGVRLRKAAVSIERLSPAGKPACTLPARAKPGLAGPLSTRRTGGDPSVVHSVRNLAGSPPPSVPWAR